MLLWEGRWVGGRTMDAISLRIESDM